MKHLKRFHLITGLLAFLLIITSITGLFQLSSEPVNLSSSAIVVLMAASLVNLMAGVSATVCYGSRRGVQAIGSILMITGIAAAVGFTADSALVIAGITLDKIALITLSAGTLIHVFISLNNPIVSHPDFADDSGRETGSVKWFNITKGFGFITRDVGDDIFVHYRAIRGEGHRTLSEGQRVEFIVIEKDKGLQAEDVIAAPKGR
nr:cold shock domain-containing protein [Endozoicomonas sp.]